MLVRPEFYGQEPGPQRGNVVLPAEVTARLTEPEPVPAILVRPEQAAYLRAKAAGATELEARAAAHRVARNGPGLPPVLLFGIVGIGALFLLRRRR